jgi:hypothetical protein
MYREGRGRQMGTDGGVPRHSGGGEGEGAACFARGSASVCTGSRARRRPGIGGPGAMGRGSGGCSLVGWAQWAGAVRKRWLAQRHEGGIGVTAWQRGWRCKGGRGRGGGRGGGSGTHARTQDGTLGGVAKASNSGHRNNFERRTLTERDGVMDLLLGVRFPQRSSAFQHAPEGWSPGQGSFQCGGGSRRPEEWRMSARGARRGSGLCGPVTAAAAAAAALKLLHCACTQAAEGLT